MKKVGLHTYTQKAMLALAAYGKMLNSTMVTDREKSVLHSGFFKAKLINGMLPSS